MGNGKGNPEYFVAEIQPGKDTVRNGWCRRSAGAPGVRLAAAKLPIQTTFVIRQVGG